MSPPQSRGQDRDSTVEAGNCQHTGNLEDGGVRFWSRLCPTLKSVSTSQSCVKYIAAQLVAQEVAIWNEGDALLLLAGLSVGDYGLWSASSPGSPMDIFIAPAS